MDNMNYSLDEVAVVIVQKKPLLVIGCQVK